MFKLKNLEQNAVSVKLLGKKIALGPRGSAECCYPAKNDSECLSDAELADAYALVMSAPNRLQVIACPTLAAPAPSHKKPTPYGKQPTIEGN